MKVILIIFLQLFNQAIDFKSIESLVFICGEFIKSFSYFFDISKFSGEQTMLCRSKSIIIIGVSEDSKVMKIKFCGTKESNQVPIICQSLVNFPTRSRTRQSAVICYELLEPDKAIIADRQFYLRSWRPFTGKNRRSVKFFLIMFSLMWQNWWRTYYWNLDPKHNIFRLFTQLICSFTENLEMLESLMNPSQVKIRLSIDLESETCLKDGRKCWKKWRLLSWLNHTNMYNLLINIELHKNRKTIFI